MKIKYLRVPDNLLDVVKDEQNRARDAGRSSRGAHVGSTYSSTPKEIRKLISAIFRSWRTQRFVVVSLP